MPDRTNQFLGLPDPSRPPNLPPDYDLPSPPPPGSPLRGPVTPLPPPPDPAHTGAPDRGPAASDVLEYRRLLLEQLARRMEAVRLYEPLPTQEKFHACRSRNRLVRGSNRAGKTLATAVEATRAVLGRDPHGKYPERDGRCYVVGRDEKHLGEVIYRKLFRPGAFRIVRDEVTGVWRSYRPWSAADAARARQSKPAPPLIPRRYVKSITWKSKGDSVPEKVTLISGWEVDFFSSLGKPPRGSDLDLVWFDEEIVESDWYPEMSARLLDRNGRLIWGATPQGGTTRLFELHQRCEEAYEDWEGREFAAEHEPEHREFFVSLADNPYIDEAQKRALEQDLSEDEADVRIRGNFAIEATRVFPEWDTRVHGVRYFDVPDHWTRYAVVDPGRQVCAVLFACVPDPEDAFPYAETPDGLAFQEVGEDEYVFLYDELYIRGCDADTFGARMAEKCRGQEFEAFIADAHGIRQHDMGSGKSLEQQYGDALRHHGIESRLTGSGFVWGSDDVAGRTEAARRWLRVRRNGQPTLRAVAVHDRLPKFKYEIERYRYKKAQNLVTDVPEDRGPVHLMACLGYLAAYGPKYVPPARGRRRYSEAYLGFLRKRAARRKADGSASVNLGPPRALP